MYIYLALIPVIGLLLFIYFNDKKEKEPFGLLIGLFFAGMGTVVTALIAENVGGLLLDLAMPYESVAKAVILATVIVGPAEEIGKYLVMRIITWKNKNFNYSYDAIVYAVFVSLGFAALENIAYVFTTGVLTALVRMVTAVPGHACYAVFMGYFYSKAKYASLTNKKGSTALFKFLAIIVPTIIHGIYDAILMGGSATGEVVLSGISFLFWIVFVTALFVVSCIFVVRSSRHDFCIVSLPGDVQTVYKTTMLGNWTCACGTVNTLNFCPKCGRARPVFNTWYCQRCGTLSAFYFCGNCGCPAPSAQPAAQPGYQAQPQYPVQQNGQIRLP
ncbi:PrsW family glutamic-type intramembrane protease [Butyrivibrio sp. AE2032]|uniref:PrsW family glutamic-type intramembrane protease n=1 Tax=Butyrivibrio sp. AE2032 TaxID=1458463 RepID=UPI00068BDC10|nr:PrsW family glutamic-type intramembrane protease [Butyrivibrio sp. AE2032]